MDSDLIKKMPASIEAEQAVLGSIIINPASFEKIAGFLTPDDFYLEEHRLIFSEIQSMFLANSSIDTVTLVNALVQSGVKDEAGGIQYISLIAQSVPSASNIKDYAVIVHDKALLRRLIGACDDISEIAYSEEGKAQDVVDRAEQIIFDIAQNRDTREFRHIKDVMSGVYQELERISESKVVSNETKTGFSGLDRVLVQLGKGDLVLVGARPGMGKTSFAMNIATNVAKHSKKTVCIFSLEMSAEQLVNRMLSSEALVDSHALRSGEINPEMWERLADAATELAGCDIYIDDTSGISVTDMKAKLRRVKNLGLVVVDYLQLMQSSRPSDNRAFEVGEISRNLKIMAKDLGIPIICCAQLSRNPESRTVKKPMLSDLRDSGAIEQDADIVLFLYRDEYYKTGEEGSGTVPDGPSTAEVIIAKNRHGAVGSVKMGWTAQFTKFRTLETDESLGVG